MFITKTKTKNSTIYYLSKSFRDRSTGKTTTKIVEKIGNEDEIRKKIGNNKSIDKWLKDYAVNKTKEEKQSSKGVNLSLNSSTKLEKDSQRIYNAGYLIIQKICYELELDKICKEIKKKEKFNGNLFQILTYSIYTFNANYEKKINILAFSQTFIEKPRFTWRQFYLALDLFAKYSFKIQHILFDKINEYTNADKSIVFYDTKSFYHDFINPDEEYEKINNNDKIIKYEVGYNSKNVPLAYSTYRENNNYTIDEIKLGEKISSYFSDATFVILSSFENPYTSLLIANKRSNTSPIRWINIRKLKKEYQQWATGKEGWTEINSQKIFTMDEIQRKINDHNIVKNNNEWLKSARFYKTKKIKWTDEKSNTSSEKLLVSIFGPDIMRENINLNKTKIENINKTINNQLFKHRNDINFCKKYLRKYDKYIDINESKLTNDKPDVLNCYTFKSDVIAKLSEITGLYTFILDLPVKDLKSILRAQTNKWLNDYTFTTVANDFNILPKYIKYENRIDAHLFTAYLSMVVWRILQFKSNYKFTDEQINNELQKFNFINVSGEGWIPCYDINNITKFFQKIIGQNTNFDFITTEQMNKIIKSTKN